MLSTLKLGDHIYVKRKLLNIFPVYSHHGIITSLEPLKITHLSRKRGIVENDSFERFSKIDSSIFQKIPNLGLKLYPSSDDFDKILDRIKELKNKKIKWKVDFHCEHFVNYVKTGEYIKFNDEYSKIFMGVIISLVITMVILNIIIELSRKSNN